MKIFRDSEKQRLIPIMKNLFSPAAIAQPGYMKKYNNSYPFCLVDSYADENLHSFIRTDAIKYFQTRNIQWHDGTNGNPSNHLCCSQSFCINALFPFQSRPDKLKELLLEIGYPVDEVLPIGPDSYNNSLCYLAFEWIGAKNYLYELSGGKAASNSQRTRGSNFTSADFAVLFKRVDQKVQLVLGEWKYTEEYRGKGSIQISKSGTDRLNKIYLPFLQKNFIKIDPYKNYSILFYDPFDQMMRLQLLAKEMESSSPTELNTDIVTTLHVAPKENEDLMRYIPNQELRCFGRNIHDIWTNIAECGKFKRIYTKDLLDIITSNKIAPDNTWSCDIKQRYNF